MNGTRTQNSIRNASNEVIVRIITTLGKFVLRTIFIKTLGIQYNGISGLFTDILTVFSLAELGINKAIAFALYKPIAENDEDTIARVMNFYKKVYRIIAVVIMLAGIIVLPFLKYLVRDAYDIKESIHVIFMLFVIQSASSYLFIYKVTLLEANQQKYIISRVNIIVTVIQVVVESALLIIFKQYLVYLVFSIVTNIGKNYVTSLIAEKKFPVLKRKNVDKLTKEETKQISADIGALSIYKVSNVAVFSTDSIITAAYLPTTVVSILSNYRLITNTLDVLLNQLFFSIVPSIGNLAVTQTSDKQYKLHRKLSFLMFALGNFIITSLFVLLNPFISDIWLGDEYIFSLPVIIAIVINFYFCIMQYPNIAFRNSNGLFVQGKYTPLTMAIINILLSIILGYFWGVFGILIATPISRIATETWFNPLILYKHIFKLPIHKYFIQRGLYLLIVTACCAVTYVFTHLVTFSNIYIDFIFKTLCCIVIPNVVTIAAFCKSEILKESFGLVFSAIKMKKKK